jgi:hypothetical protein
VEVSKSETICDIYVTPSDMLNSIRNLLDWEEGADVKFKVKGERFSIPTR